MDVIGCIVDVVCRGWNCVQEQQFEEKLGELRLLMGELKERRDSVMSRVEAEEAGQLKRTPEVDAWLKSFDHLEKDVTSVLQEGDKLLNIGCITAWCPWNCWTNQKFGKKVVSKISLVNGLRDKGAFQVQDVVERRSPTQVQEVPEDPYTVGLDSASSSVWRLLEQDSVGIIGLYGLGGVGKTTLLKKINNMLLTRSSGFFVIWVVVSKEVSMERVQKDIGDRLGLSWSENVGMSSRARDIFNKLRSKKYLLLLDDIWERLELTTIGIPPPSVANKSKIIFTTRSEAVCGDMEANEKVRVECLNWSQAWDLFQNKVGGGICSDPEIQPLAETVAKECDGLPLALTVIGRTMASKKTAREWRDAITTLQKHAERLKGMDKVFSVLKYSYDDLADDSIRSCFLFCSLYPEDYPIDVETLVKQWIGKGYIDGFDEWEEAINIGHRNIGILKALSLLEEADYGICVKMHDVIRDMAHWIEKDKILVITDARFSEARRTEKLMKAQSITVWGDEGLKWLGDKPDCPKVTTFLLVRVQRIPDDFFLLMPALKFVHISGIVNIPTSIFKLDFLEYLFCINTDRRSGIKILHEMKNLTSLKYLWLGDPSREWRVPADVIIHLPNLKQVQLFIGLHHDTETHIQDLQCSNELISADFTIEKVKDLEFVLNNQRLLDYTMGLYIGGFQVETKTIKQLALPPLPSSSLSCFTLAYMKILGLLSIYECPEMGAFSCSALRIRGFKQLALSPLPSSSLSCFTLAYMKRLRRLEISACLEMEELLLSCLPDDTEIPLFQSLEEMTLSDLPKLVVTWDIRNIHSQCFRNLHQVTIDECNSMTNVTWLLLAPNLRELDIRSCEGIEEIISNASGACEESTFSNLKRLELQLLPNLRLVCANVLPLPSLEHILVCNCPGLRRLPLNPNNSPNNKVRSIDIEGEQKWWDNLQWESDPTKSAFVEFISFWEWD